MNSAAFISIASLILGLGLWLLGKRRAAAIAAVLVFGAVLIFYFSPWQALAGFSCNLALVLWSMQVMYTVYEARLMQALKSGDLQQVKEGMPIVAPSADLSRSEKLAFKSIEIVRQQLEFGEHILDAVPGARMSALRGGSSYRFDHIGLLADKFAFVSTDFLGKPAGIQRIGFSSIQSLTVRHGLLSDNLLISMNDKKLLLFKVTRRLRSHTDNFVTIFTKQKNLQR